MTDVLCLECGHVRETTEEYPTLVTCEECGSGRLEYDREEADTIRSEAEKAMRGTTVRVTVEVDADGMLSREDRALLADDIMDSAVGSELAEWDDDHPDPTWRNEVV